MTIPNSAPTTKMLINWPFASEAQYALGNYVEIQKCGSPPKVYEGGLEVAQLQTDRTVHAVPVHNRDTIFDVNGRSSANQTGTIMQTVFVKFDCFDFEAAWSNNYRLSNTYVPNTNTISIKASIEINGVISPLYFNGQRIKILNEGAVVTCDTFGGLVKSTDLVKILTYFDVGAGGFLPLGYDMTAPGFFVGTDGLEYGVDKVDTGGVGDTGPLMESWGFCNVLANPTEGRKPAVLLIGDSIMRAGDAWDDTTGLSGKDGINSGFGPIAMKEGAIPWTNISCPGETADVFLNNISTRTPFVKGHDYVLGNYGANDIVGTMSTFEELRDMTIAIWEYYKSFGLKVVWATLIPIIPVENTTDNYFTEAGQTLTAYEPIRLEYNDWLLNTAPVEYSNLLYGIIDVDAVAGNGGKWKEFTGYDYSGQADSGTVNTIFDAALPVEKKSGTWNFSAFVVFTGGTGFGEDPRKILSYEQPTGRIIFDVDLSVAVDATTEYSVKYVPTTDGIHPTAVTANTRMAPAIDTSIFR